MTMHKQYCRFFGMLLAICMAAATLMFAGTAVADNTVDVPSNGWNADRSRWYDNGVMARNHAFYDPESDAWYWADADGSIAAGKDVFIPRDESDRSKGGKWVRFREDRTMVKGEDFKDGGWYYFDPITGAMAKGVRFVPSNGGKWVYYDWVTGQMAHGEAYVSYDAEHTGWYYFDPVTGAMKHGDMFVRSNGGKWVRYDDVTGKMVKGEDHRYGGWYYFDPVTGAMAKGFTNLPDGRRVFYDRTTGKMLYGWQTIDGTRCYFNTVTGNLERQETGGGTSSPTEPSANHAAWWSPSSTVYHTSQDCGSYKRIKHPVGGTVGQARQAGRTWCKNCQNLPW